MSIVKFKLPLLNNYAFCTTSNTVISYKRAAPKPLKKRYSYNLEGSNWTHSELKGLITVATATAVEAPQPTDTELLDKNNRLTCPIVVVDGGQFTEHSAGEYISSIINDYIYNTDHSHIIAVLPTNPPKTVKISCKITVEPVTQ